MSEDGDRMTRETQLPAHRHGHGPADEQEKDSRDEELHRDHLVVGVPDPVHDAGLAVAMVIAMVGGGCVTVGGDGSAHGLRGYSLREMRSSWLPWVRWKRPGGPKAPKGL